jgi:hypothetical protein
MSKNKEKDLEELKQLLKVEIKNQIDEFGPLSTLQGIVRGIAGIAFDKKRNIKNAEIDMKIAKVKKQRAGAYKKMVLLAKKLEKRYGSWDKIPKFYKSDLEKVPDIQNLMKNI